MTSVERSERMGYEPIGRLLLQFSIPAIVGMVASALYNIVDRMFIGHAVGPNGIAAITVAFPFFLLIISTGILIGVGSSSQISRGLGAGNPERAQKVMGNGFIAMVVSSVLVVTVGFTFMDDLMRLCGASPIIMPMTKDYMSIVLWGVPFQLIGFCCNYFIRAEGHPRYAMGTLILGAFANIVLDWIFIVKMGMGVKGAALGTVVAQFGAACWVIAFYVRGVGQLRFVRSAFRPDRSILTEMAAVGFSPFMMEMFFVMVMILFNRTLSRLGGEMAISAMGIFFSLDSILFMPAIGIGEGAQPLIGYNYGAGNFERVRKTVYLAMGAAVGFFICSLIVAQAFPRQLTMLFNKDSQELISMTVRAMRIGYLGLPMAGIAIISGFVFQALGKAKQSIILNLCRQFFFLLPPLLLLPPFFGVDGVWATFPIVDVGGGVLGWFMVRAEMKRWNNSLFEDN
ncbi:MATE family efflux transporter [Dethiosulfovibrio salsuginis]|uniref:Multidrug export protein MepA n=1 Tax=Dethiosulfovibrio salsuginis TaxID=561720 RepID=A0A1X7J738_9BACT|nr:MATE family efflux transporter [Dethiosulfovibrio salsuginis]SMG23399.1 putative efflux protein, MATE family [Dethiosulfovibrio salsuginis]